MAVHKFSELFEMTNAPGYITLSVVFTILVYLFVGLRFYGRFLKKVPIGVEDWLILAAAVFNNVLSGMVIYGFAHGSLGTHSVLAPNGLPQSTPEELESHKIENFFQLLEIPTLALIKLSMCLLYRRIFEHRVFRIINMILIVLVVMWALAFIFAKIFECGTHFDAAWGSIEDLQKYCYNTFTELNAYTASDFAFDCVIVIQPLPMIWKLNMPTAQKISLTLIFALAILTLAASCIRMSIYVWSLSHTIDPDLIQTITWLLVWTLIETSVGILTACLVTMRPILDKLGFTGLRSRVMARYGESRTGTRTTYRNTRGSGFVHMPRDPDTTSISSVSRLKSTGGTKSASRGLPEEDDLELQALPDTQRSGQRGGEKTRHGEVGYAG